MSFTHKTTYPSPSIVVGGRVNYGIGRVLKHRLIKNATDQRKHCFYSLLLLVMAKSQSNFDHAKAQLIVYLASLRQSRMLRNRTDTSVYGVVSDGYIFIFQTMGPWCAAGLLIFYMAKWRKFWGVWDISWRLQRSGARNRHWRDISVTGIITR